jgi:hypothetical protein
MPMTVLVDLALTGETRPIKGVLAMALQASADGVPMERMEY